MLHHPVMIIGEDDVVDVVETVIMVVEEDEEEDSVHMRIMRTYTKMKVAR
uniref:Uncharacterized protein n=1 Tax=Brassica oleracea var. oleracea TaxID=109376 RepID=A0A0D3D5S7_BRAOL